MFIRLFTVLCLVCPCVLVAAADDGLRVGTMATLAPLCGMRDQDWANDLRSAEMQALTKTKNEPQAAATLSYAEDEAVETFAEDGAEKTCAALKRDPDLKRADDLVTAFRSGSKV